MWFGNQRDYKKEAAYGDMFVSVLPAKAGLVCIFAVGKN